MKRKEKTELLRSLLKTKLNSKRGVHSAAEVSLDYGTKNVKRVDFVSFEPRDQVSIAGLEAGTFTFYVLDEFERPNNLTTAIDWELVVVKAAHRKQRKRSIGELLFCMLRSAGNK